MFAVQQLAVDNAGPIGFSLAAGDCLGLSGPSGAGKTRLLRAMADLDAHTGRCYLHERPAEQFEAPDWRRQVMFLPAESAWWADTPGAHLPDNASAVPDWLAALDLDPILLERPLGRLSSGQRQRLAILRLLAHDPDVLLLDEPTANLDAANITRVEHLVRDYCHQRSAGCVWVGHDHEQLRRVADQRRHLDANGYAACS